VRFADLDSWLRWQEGLHPAAVELGLDRVGAVAARLAPLPASTRVVTVAGTNGKGSCVAVMDAVLRADGRRVVAYTSPHLHRYNERIRVDGRPVEDAALLEAFAAVDEARGDTALTYFEFGTLAALQLAARVAPEVLLLEVGLGGRLDAVNVVDPEVAVVTTIGLDHQDWLGPDRETIGAEKAGIFRTGVPVVLGEAEPPASVLRRARDLGCAVTRLGRDFRAVPSADGWRFEGSMRTVTKLPAGALPGVLLDNAATAVEAVDRLPDQPPPAEGAVREGCRLPALPGRLQHVTGPVEWLLDLAHNPPAAAALAAYVKSLPAAAATHAVIGLYADKDATAVIDALAGVTELWWCVRTPGERGRSAAELAATVRSRGGRVKGEFDDVRDALAAAGSAARPGDRVLVLGSFSVVGPALELLGGDAAAGPS
jgi:dihydrofolate synthase/folylpolyglutamate synthase